LLNQPFNFKCLKVGNSGNIWERNYLG